MLKKVWKFQHKPYIYIINYLIIKNKTMENLQFKLEELGFEDCSEGSSVSLSEWLNDNQREPKTLKGWCKSLNCLNLFDDLNTGLKNGDITIVFDDRCMTVNFK
jgi:hypothetical protein